MQLVSNYKDIVLNAWKRQLATSSLEHYAGILCMQALARLAKITKAQEILTELREHISPFWRGEVKGTVGVYGDTVYRWGGNATAFLVARGMLPEASEALLESAESLCTDQPRDSRGIFHFPSGNRTDGSEGFIWIDTVFGVCPFLIWAGQAAKRQDFIEESCFQMLRHHEILFNKSRGLYHQAVNFNRPGELTPSFWSRGCGWGALALAEMVYDLPEQHKDYDKILSAYRDLLCGCLDHMDGNGMLHQAVEDESTYAETSGTALVLYAMGRGIKNKSLDRNKFTPPFLKGLKGILRYIALDGSLFNCCRGCLAPGNGTTEDYAKMPWQLNDIHGLGAVMLLFGQAEQLENNGLIPKLEEL